jgi:hypothetical protein
MGPIDKCPDFEYHGCQFLSGAWIDGMSLPDGVMITFYDCLLPIGLFNGAYRVVNGRLKRRVFLSLLLKVYWPVRDWISGRKSDADV